MPKAVIIGVGPDRGLGAPPLVPPAAAPPFSPTVAFCPAISSPMRRSAKPQSTDNPRVNARLLSCRRAAIARMMSDADTQRIDPQSNE